MPPLLLGSTLDVKGLCSRGKSELELAMELKTSNELPVESGGQFHSDKVCVVVNCLPWVY